MTWREITGDLPGEKLTLFTKKHKCQHVSLSSLQYSVAASYQAAALGETPEPSSFAYFKK